MREVSVSECVSLARVGTNSRTKNKMRNRWGNERAGLDISDKTKVHRETIEGL